MSFIDAVSRPIQLTTGGIDRFGSFIDLVIRLWVANVFWKSGLTKITSWDSTLYLFEYEYAVPLIPAGLAAVLGTGMELTMPVLLAIGLGSRFSALALFIFSIIAVISYPTLHEVGFKDHVYWGLLLAVTFFHGPGAFSLDHLIRKRLC